MGGFSLLGKTFLFRPSVYECCLCVGIYGYITQEDEDILSNHSSFDECIMLLSHNLKERMLDLFDTHVNTPHIYVYSHLLCQLIGNHHPMGRVLVRATASLSTHWINYLLLPQYIINDQK